VGAGANSKGCMYMDADDGHMGTQYSGLRWYHDTGSRRAWVFLLRCAECRRRVAQGVDALRGGDSDEHWESDREYEECNCPSAIVPGILVLPTVPLRQVIVISPRTALHPAVDIEF